MESAPLPATEVERLRALRTYEIVDSLPEPAYDGIVQLAAELCRTPIALVSLVEEDRQWFKAAVGPTVPEMRRALTFCAHAILQPGLFVVRDAAQDARFAHNPLVRSEPRIRFYAGAPLRGSGGHALGTLCVIDVVARDLEGWCRRALRTLADQVEAHLELRLRARELARRETQLEEQRNALLRLQRQKDELSALVVHDLKSPMAGVTLNAQYLLDLDLPDEAREATADIVGAMENMNCLVMNLLDISRSDEGQLVPRPTALDVMQLLAEAQRDAARRALAKGQRVTISAALEEARLEADRELLRRVIDNLLDNSFKYGPAGSAIQLEARALPDDWIELAVRDEGQPVAVSNRTKIFDRYVQLDDARDNGTRCGRGLGLAFCRLAIEAHGGTIFVEEAAERSGNVFRVRLPRRSPVLSQRRASMPAPDSSATDTAPEDPPHPAR